MNKEKMNQLSTDELISALNQEYSVEPSAILDQFESSGEVEHFDGICAECYGQTSQKSSGDEGVTVCPNCRSVEGKTYEISILKPLKVAYNWNLQFWLVASDDIGSEL